jgi:fructosamine-3-kinase
MSPVPEPILQALSLPNNTEATLSTNLASGFTNTAILDAKIPNKTTKTPDKLKFFIKTSPAGPSASEMFRGEYESLNAIATSVPGFCPRALAWGPLEEGNSKTFFLATEYIDLRAGRFGSSDDDESTATLAHRLGKLHTTPAPIDESGRRRFGFPVPTFCGDTKQSNLFRDSWAAFFAEERLLTILGSSEDRNGSDAGLRELVEKTVHSVVPRLLGDDHLGYDSDGQGEGIVPVVIHGDLWSGNVGWGRILGSGSGSGEDQAGDVVYDPSACYGHSEFELGIMNMFGGFGAGFFEKYHRVVPKTEPVGEYDDRVRLYEL